MKKIYSVTLLLLISFIAYSAKVTITNVGVTFSPSSAEINVGDTVIFQLGGSHNAVEVSQSTYDADGNTSNGGFSLPFGGGSVKLTQAGTFYFVCEPHASIGMKGFITVNQSTGIKDWQVNSFNSIYPNPAREFVNISFTLKNKSTVVFTLVNIKGQVVYKKAITYPKSGDIIQSIHPNFVLPKGKYILRAQISDGTVTTGKILIE